MECLLAVARGSKIIDDKSSNLLFSMILKLQDSRALESRLDMDASRWETQIFNRSNYWNEYVTLVKLFIRLFQLIHADHCKVCRRDFHSSYY